MASLLEGAAPGNIENNPGSGIQQTGPNAGPTSYLKNEDNSGDLEGGGEAKMGDNVVRHLVQCVAEGTE